MDTRPRGPLDTLVDAEPPTGVIVTESIETIPHTERAPGPPDPRDFPRSETKIALFGLADRADVGQR